MQDTVFIYALCEPGTRTVRYIGKTVNLKKRLGEHLRGSSKEEHHLGRWLKSLSVRGEKPNMVTLAKASVETWQAEEMRYIQAARILGVDLTNSTDGGDGCVNPTPENRAAISARMSGEKNPMFGKTGAANPSFGKVKAPETLALMRAKKLGGKLTEEHKAAIAATMQGEDNHFFGKKHTPESLALMSGVKNPMFGRTGWSHPDFGKKHAGASSPFLGVLWYKKGRKWRANISFGRKIYLGQFETEIEAAQAYDAAAIKFFGSRAKLNFPDRLIAAAAYLQKTP